MSRSTEHQYQKIADLIVEARTKQSKRTIKVAQELRVPLSTVEQLESPESSTIPPANMFGLYKRYAQYLRLDVQTIEALLKAGEPAKTKRRQRKATGIKRKRSIAIPKLSRFVTITAIAGIVVGYAALQVVGFNAPPRLDIINPAPVSVSGDPLVLLEGISESDVSVFVGGELITLDDNNAFNLELHLQPGVNVIEVSAVDGFSKQNTRQLTITFNPTDSEQAEVTRLE